MKNVTKPSSKAMQRQLDTLYETMKASINVAYAEMQACIDVERENMINELDMAFNNVQEQIDDLAEKNVRKPPTPTRLVAAA